MVIEKKCRGCRELKPRSEFGDDGKRTLCVSCWAEYSACTLKRKITKAALERRNLKQSTYQAMTWETRRLKQKEWRQANIERGNARKRREFAANPERVLARHQVWRNRLKLEVFEHYGGAVCACCGENTFEILTLDNVNNDGSNNSKEMKQRKVGTVIYSWFKKNN